MKRILLFISVLAFISPLKSQEFTNANLTSMVKSEREFSSSAKEFSTRHAFLSFTNDESLGFNNGPISIKKDWEQRQADSSWLWWEPDYADIASSGEFGFTTGPWEYRKNRQDEKAVAQGHFFTIWRKDSGGIWKVLIDMGVQYNQSVKRVKISTTSIPLQSSQNSTKEDLLKIEKEFMAKQSTETLNAYNNALSIEARYYQNQYQPFIGKDIVVDHLSKRESVTYTCLDGFIALSGDMGVVYGTASFNTDDKTSSKKHGYLRVWKKEDSTTWKLVIEVLE